MKPFYLKGKQALLLDMNSTFMFGEDRFGSTEDFSLAYQNLGGKLSGPRVNQLIRECYNHLDYCYPLLEYRDNFPTLAETFQKVSGEHLSDTELGYLVATFSHHERGCIPAEYVDTLRKLGKRYRLALVIDIWAPKNLWVSYFRELDIFDWFEAISFSSDCGCVKPSPSGFLQVLHEMNLLPHEAIVIGDSVRRDLGGAMQAGIDCALVGGGQSKEAIAVYPDLLTLSKDWG
jgi:phosphoglycolate phosphatase-like HAD superfamily hydrolase